MPSILDTLGDDFFKALEKAPQAGELSEAERFNAIVITPSTQSQYGDYQCNSAMKLAKVFKLPPRAVADQLVANLGNSPAIEQVEIAGPGFINITLSKVWLEQRLIEIQQSDRLGISPPKNPQRVIVEFSSPNIAKELHVGHLRSTIIGEHIARLFEFLGHDVLRLNHVGDWGTAFGMLIHFIKSTHPNFLSETEWIELSDLVIWYREAKQRFDADEVFKSASRLEVVALQSGDPTNLEIWKQICQISRRGFSEIYHLLDVTLEERGESFYNPMLAEVVEDLENKGLITVSDGAKCCFLEGFTSREGEPLPMIVQKSDGGFNYSTTDLAALKHRIEVEKADRIIITTDAGQALHFQMLLKASQMAGTYDPAKTRVDHVTFGLVLGPDGKKFRTRSGETESLMNLLQTAINKAAEGLKERSPEISEEEMMESARVLGIGAVKYADLSTNRTGDYQFSYEKMLRFDGNTAAFILYAYVRTQNILKRIGHSHSLTPPHPISLNHPSERALGLQLARFEETLETVAEELMPNKLTEYLYRLAELFNAFYRDCHVEGSDEVDSRGELCSLTGKTLHCGLSLLGIHTLERM
ncbi:MAG: arginine--tRNA ligase [Chlamydiia bacterium]|nr:arginine--tRNA ligase [Chlamydiia bacterium]